MHVYNMFECEVESGFCNGVNNTIVRIQNEPDDERKIRKKNQCKNYNGEEEEKKNGMK